MPLVPCELCNSQKVVLPEVICYGCACKLHDNVRKIIQTGTVEEVLNALSDPRLCHERSLSCPLDWACVYGNLPVMHELLKDPNIRLRSEKKTLVECVKKGYTEVVSTILLRQKAKVCDRCPHSLCILRRQLLTLASLCGQEEISDFLVRTYGLDEISRVKPPLNNGRKAFGVSICTSCCKPTDQFLPCLQGPICSDCLSESKEYCNDRACTGMELRRLHRDIQPLRWDHETQSFDGKDGTCCRPKCERKGRWTLHGNDQLHFRLMCESCHQSKRHCFGCNLKDLVVRHEHTCEATFDLIDGYFYKVDANPAK